MNLLSGQWRHYKGHVYELLGVAKHSETTEELGLAYKRLDSPEVFVWVRPEVMWRESVEMPDGRSVPRFELLSRETPYQQLSRQFDELAQQNAHLKALLEKQMAWSEDDDPLPEDEAIHAEHPTRNKIFDTYTEAMRLVGAKRSKFALVDLVNWLLVRLKKTSEGKSELS